MKIIIMIGVVLSMMSVGCFTVYESERPFEYINYDYSLKGNKIKVVGFPHSKMEATGQSFSSGSATAYTPQGTAYATGSSTTTHYSQVTNYRCKSQIENYLEERGANILSKEPDIIIVGDRMYCYCVNWSSALKFLPLGICSLGSMIGEDYESGSGFKVYNKNGDLLYKYKTPNFEGTYIGFYPWGPLTLPVLFLPQWMEAHNQCEGMLLRFAAEDMLQHFEKALIEGRFDEALTQKMTVQSDSQRVIK